MSREGWFAPSYGIPDPVRQQIAQWVQQVPWPATTKLQDPSKYHITSFYAPEGYQEPANHQWLQQNTDQGFPATTHSLDSFSSPDPRSGLSPVVMRFHAPELSAHAEQLMTAAEERGLQPARFEGGHKPHITVAHSSELPEAVPPQINFTTEPLHELHSYYDSLKQGTVANILDPVHSTLDPRVFDDPAAPQPKLKEELQTWLIQVIFEVLERHGYDNPAKWLSLVLTGSLTTYQYSDASDCDISLFVDTKKFPDWSRAEMIAIMVSNFDNVTVPGTPHPLQAYVVPPDLKPKDLYKPGLRSGYVVCGKKAGSWLVPPDRDRVHDVEKEMNDAYMVGLLSADKLDLLARFEPDQAEEYWQQVHKRRRDDQMQGKGDFATSNVVYKMIVNRFGENPHFA